MGILEDAKKLAETATGWARPTPDDLADLVRERQLRNFRLKDDGVIPNHPRWPLVVYRSPVRLAKALRLWKPVTRRGSKAG